MIFVAVSRPGKQGHNSDLGLTGAGWKGGKSLHSPWAGNGLGWKVMDAETCLNFDKDAKTTDPCSARCSHPGDICPCRFSQPLPMFLRWLLFLLVLRMGESEFKGSDLAAELTWGESKIMSSAVGTWSSSVCLCI